MENKEPTMRYIDGNELDSYGDALAEEVFEKQGFKNIDVLIGVWRGGAPLALKITDYYEQRDHDIQEHGTVRTKAYGKDRKIKKSIKVYKTLDYFTEIFNQEWGNVKVLIVDDLIETGSSIRALLDAIKEKCTGNTPIDIRIATIFVKPTKFIKPEAQGPLFKHPITGKEIPVYYLEETNDWIVFPHEKRKLSNGSSKHQRVRSRNSDSDGSDSSPPEYVTE